MEIWKAIPGHEGYEASSYGRIKRLASRNKQGKLYKDKILKLGHNRNGYMRVNIRYRNFLVHRLVASAFIPNPNNLPFINHKDFKRDNNHIDNLEWCTPKHNAQYSRINHGNAKLSDIEVMSIKRLLGFIPNKDIAYLFKVSPTCISLIKTGKSYAHLSTI